MIELERHIEILLLTNDCVIVPGLGGFMAHYVEARYDEGDGLFLPPLRTLGFNPQLKLNDSLLVQSYIEAYDISYPEALRRVEAEVRELRQHLETARTYELNDIGVLHYNDEGKLEFEPCEAGILTPQLYGLSTFQMPLLSTAGQKPEPTAQAVHSTAKHAAAESDDSDERAITIPLSWLRNLAAAAAAVLAFLMISTPVSTDTALLQSSLLPAGSSRARTFNNVPEQGISYDDWLMVTELLESTNTEPETQADEPAAPTADNLQTASPAPAGKSYCLVLACQISQRNAEAFAAQLQSEGFNGVSITNSKSMRRVVYGSYPTEDEAYNALRDLRRQSSHFRQAWVMKVKQ